MHALIRMAITALAMTLAWGTHAKSAIEVFEAVSRSVVVVQGEDATGKLLSLGSGVVIMNGVVATNCHVTNKAARLKVIYQDKAYPAIARHTDGDRDVCSLTVEGMKAPVATLGYTNTLKVGQRVYAIGAPEGLELTLSEGIVSSLREVTGGRYIQTTAPISPGSSGGGLFDEDGRLLGLPTFYLAEGQQLNFAVPVEWVRELPGRHTALTPAADSELDWLNRAVVLETKKDWQGLVRHALGWTKARPRDASAWYVLGIAYGQVRQPAKEIEAYQQALRIDSQHVDAWYNLGNAYADAGQPAKAIEAYQRA
ncbi:MAG: trypsin-like peptidase domain-containing protein, partial [Porticoccaceae bacterium]